MYSANQNCRISGNLRLILISVFYEHIASSEQKRNAPKTCQRNNGEYYSAYYRRLTAEYPTNYIKVEYADASPIQCADNYENKCYSVQHGIESLFYPKSLSEIMNGSGFRCRNIIVYGFRLIIHVFCFCILPVGYL